MYKVTSAQLIKQFGRYHDTALREPVTVTKHGRDSVVMMSVEAFQRLAQPMQQPVPAQTPDPDLPEILETAEFAAEQAQMDDEAQDWMP